MARTLICAMFRQTWYETARRNLSAEDRLRFYETCFEYEFSRNEPDPNLPFASKLLFDMVREDIDNDLAKIAARAERNRQNALGRKITEDNTTHSQRVGATGRHNTNTIYNIQQHVTLDNNDDEDTHTLFAICLDFFERGCSDPVGEANRMWNYYSSLGWITKSGGQIVDKLAAAKAWRLPDISKAASLRRLEYAKLLKVIHAHDPELIRQFVGCRRTNNPPSVVITFADDTTYLSLENSLSKYPEPYKQWIGEGFTLDYVNHKSSP